MTNLIDNLIIDGGGQLFLFRCMTEYMSGEDIHNFKLVCKKWQEFLNIALWRLGRKTMEAKLEYCWKFGTLKTKTNINMEELFDNITCSGSGGKTILLANTRTGKVLSVDPNTLDTKFELHIENLTKVHYPKHPNFDHKDTVLFFEGNHGVILRNHKNVDKCEDCLIKELDIKIYDIKTGELQTLKCLYNCDISVDAADTHSLTDHVIIKAVMGCYIYFDTEKGDGIRRIKFDREASTYQLDKDFLISSSHPSDRRQRFKTCCIEIFDNSHLQLRHKAEEGYYIFTYGEQAEIYDIKSRQKIITLEELSGLQNENSKFMRQIFETEFIYETDFVDDKWPPLIIKHVIFRLIGFNVAMAIYDICSGTILRILQFDKLKTLSGLEEEECRFITRNDDRYNLY